MKFRSSSTNLPTAARLIVYAGSVLVPVLALTGCLGGGGSDTAQYECQPGDACGSGGDDDLLPSQVVTCKNQGGEFAQVLPKTISVHNNSAGTIYPVLTTSKNPVNQWIQGCLRTKAPHPSHYVYKLYINEGQGLPPGASATVTLPLYSELADDALDGAKETYQYITWWNGGRVVLADRNDRLLDRYDAAKNPGGKDFSFQVPESVTCAAQGATCTLSTYFSENQLPENINAQLSEYTFGDSDVAADDPQQLRRLKPENVGYNISYVDHVYLPVAIGPKDNPYIGYSGSAQSLEAFRATISSFLGAAGEGWPVYNLANGLKLPGGYNIFAQRHDDLIVDDSVPVRQEGKNLAPLLTVRKCLDGQCSDAEKGALRFGAAVQRMQNLWGTCVSGWTFLDREGNAVDKSVFVNGDAVGDCDIELESGLTLRQGLTAVRDFFVKNHQDYLALYAAGKCNGSAPVVPTFDYWQAIKHIYGWVPFNEGCGADANRLSDTAIAGWNHATIQSKYIDLLQYNHQNASVQGDPTLLFNPYVQLIHDKNNGLDMNAYGFSVDDAVGFMSELANGLIFTVGGTDGLENPKPFNYKDGFELKVGVDDAKIGPNETMIKFYGVCVINEDPDDPDCLNAFQAVTQPQGRRIPAFRVGTVKQYPIRVTFTDLNDNVYSIRVEQPFEECKPVKEGVNCVPPNASVLFDRSNINAETSKVSCIVRKGHLGEVHPKSKQWCDGADPNQSKDKQLTKSYLSFPPLVDYL